jgi:hypothetical protein
VLSLGFLLSIQQAKVKLNIHEDKRIVFLHSFTIIFHKKMHWQEKKEQKSKLEKNPSLIWEKNGKYTPLLPMQRQDSVSCGGRARLKSPWLLQTASINIRERKRCLKK